MLTEIKKLRDYARAEREWVAREQYKSGLYSRSGGDGAQSALRHIENRLEAMYEAICEAQAAPTIVIKM